MVNDWPIRKLVDLATEITVGYVGSMSKEYVDEGVPFLRYIIYIIYIYIYISMLKNFK